MGTGIRAAVSTDPCCSPPCDYTVCLDVYRCDGASGLIEVEWTKGPTILNQSATAASHVFCLTNPAAGTWFYTVTSPDHDTVSGTATVTACGSQTITVFLPNDFATLTWTLPTCDCTGRTVTVRDGGGSVVATADACDGQVTIDVTGKTAPETYTAELSPFDGGYDPVPMEPDPVLSAGPTGCRVFTGGPFSFTDSFYVKSGYCVACQCGTLGSSLSYADVQGACSLVESDSSALCGTYYGSYTFNYAQYPTPCILYGVDQGYYVETTFPVAVRIEATVAGTGPTRTWQVKKKFYYQSFTIEPACPTPPPPFPASRPTGFRLQNNADAGRIDCELRAVASDAFTCADSPDVLVTGTWGAGNSPSSGSCHFTAGNFPPGLGGAWSINN